MNFFITQYINALSLRKHWLIYAFIPSILYLLIMALSPIKFTISQTLLVSDSDNSQQNKIISERIDYILAHPDNIFLRTNVVDSLQKDVVLNAILPEKNWTDLSSKQQDYLFKNLISQTMTIKKIDNNTIFIIYNGENSVLGNKFVSFYSNQIKETIENFSKKNPWVTLFNKSDTDSKLKKLTGSIKLIDKIKSQKQRALWSKERIMPFLVLLGITLFIILIVIGIFERLNPRIISVRQTSDYLQIPVFGTLPDLKKLLDTMK